MPTENGIVLACWGDTHCGHRVGIQKPGQYQFDNGNVSSDPPRRSLYRRFVQYAEGIAKRREGRKLVTVLMGDLIDGDHHNTRELLTRYPHEQREIFEDIWWEYVSITGHDPDAGDRVYVMRGTDIRDTHGSPSDAHEIGREIGSVPYSPPKKLKEYDEFGEERETGGSYAWSNLELVIHGNLVQLTHHAPAGKGTRAHTYGNVMRSWARSMQQLRDARRLRIPRYIVWAHKHTAHSVTVQLDDGTPTGPLTTAVCTPAFQGRTYWVDQVIPLGLPTSIGGWWATFDSDGSTQDALDFVELPLSKKPEVI